MDCYVEYFGYDFYPCGYPYSRYSINVFGVVYDTFLECIVNCTKGPNTKYIGVSLVKDGESVTKTVHIHRLLAKVFLPNVSGLDFEKCQIDHINGIKTDNNLSNLEIVTPQENKIRAYRTGLRSDNNVTILTNVVTNEETVFYSQAEAARFLGINPGSFCEYLKKHGNILTNYHGFNVFRT